MDKNFDWGIGYLGAGAMPTAKTDLGVGVKLGFGKSWSVSPRWGLGAALEVLGGSVPDGNVRWNVATIGLGMSAIYR
jgi:hypothetical protein